MAKIKASELTGAALDWAVAKCEGIEGYTFKDGSIGYVVLANYKPSTNWSQGGPIIDREKINVVHLGETLPDAMAPHAACCGANIDGMYQSYGPTSLIAAMRCYVASKLGDEVEVPDELLQN